MKLSPLAAGLFIFLAGMALVLPASAASMPVAAFVSNATSGTTPFGVLFIDESTNTPISWLWSFGDGSTSTVQAPTHTYTSAGTYTVTLTATNAAGSNTVTKSDYITVSKMGSAPVAAFVANLTSGTVPLSIQFVDASSNSPTSWAWSFGDGGTSTAQNPTHTYTSVGTYTVTLTATNTAGSNTLSESGEITVTKVASVPAASFTSVETSGTVPLSIQFVDASSNSPTSWAWSFGDGGSSSEENPSYTYASVGTYTVTLTATNAAGSNTVTETGYITVTAAAPLASFSANVTGGAQPLAVSFTDSSSNSPTSWYWTLGDGYTSSSQNVTHTYTAIGTYTVTLTASNSEGSNETSESDYITVTSGVIVPAVSFSADVSAGPTPLTVQFTDTSANSPTSWFWSFGDGESSTLENPAHTYAAGGTYTVKLTAANSAGSNSVTRSGYITVTGGEVTTPQTPVQAATPAPVTTITAAQPAATASVIPTNASSESRSYGLLPVAGVLVLAVIGVVVWIFLRRPPRGPCHHGGREL